MTDVFICWQPYIHVLPCLSAEAWAAWMQALLSVAAILATWGITAWQSAATLTRERERGVEDIFDKLDAMINIARAIDDLMSRHIYFLDEKMEDNFIDAEQSLRKLNEILRKIALHEYPYSLIATDVLNYIDAVDDYLIAAAKLLGAHPEKIEIFRECQSIANDQCKALQIPFHGICNTIRVRTGLIKLPRTKSR